MTGLDIKYLKRESWYLGGVGLLALLAAVTGLTHALATISPAAESAQSEAVALKADRRFSEASLTRFGQSMDPGIFALVQRYAPAQPIRLPKTATAPTEISYDNDPGPLPAGYRALGHDDAAAANSKVPFSEAPNPPAEPFTLPVADQVAKTRALDCLTMAVYYEAASESDEGEAAVAQVVLNRLRNPLFPKTVCGVVFEGSKLPTGCQFSFTCDGSLARQPSPAGWKRARDTAARALNGYVLKAVGEATHYHTMWVVPYWQPSVVKLTQIGAHIFYRWPGSLGLPSAFRQQYAGQEEAPPAIPGFVGEARAMAVLTAADAAAPPKTVVPAVNEIAKPVELANLTVPKDAVVVSAAAAIGPISAPKPNYFGSAPIPSRRRVMATGW